MVYSISRKYLNVCNGSLSPSRSIVDRPAESSAGTSTPRCHPGRVGIRPIVIIGTQYTSFGTKMHRYILAFLLAGIVLTDRLAAQDSLRYFRIYLKDKGTTSRTLLPSDPMYPAATAHLTPRALARRAKVLPPDSLVSTDDLPIYPSYLAAVAASGAEVAETSRWFNTIMVRTDSTTYLSLLKLPFVDSVRVVATNKTVANPFPKPTPSLSYSFQETPSASPTGCLDGLYGLAATQNKLIGMDYAHRLGIAGEGILVGILDAGFGWRKHATLVDADVIAEHDFVYDDDTTSDQGDEPSAEYHGTTVMSCIGGYWEGTFVGGAPHVSFVLGRTEDIRSERNIEEDHYVAALEWMEALGVDVTNASLGYTVFDPPEQSHPYSDLNGHTAFASQGINHCVRLGVVCVNAAGNDFLSGYKYVGVPAEADSAIAVAAVDSNGVIASFSSRGFRGNGRLKPDLAAMGVRVYGADRRDSTTITAAQGTSLASPLAAAAVALVLSARPDLTPYQVRTLLTSTATHAASPDTAYGYGVIDLERAFRKLSSEQPLVGFPRVLNYNNLGGTYPDNLTGLSVWAWIEYPLGDEPATAASNPRAIELTARFGNGQTESAIENAPTSGLIQWRLNEPTATTLLQNDSIHLTITRKVDGKVLRKASLELGEGDAFAMPLSTVCAEPQYDNTTVSISPATPNPFRDHTLLTFWLPGPTTATIDIYNELGERVMRALDHETLSEGYHTTEFHAEGLPSGAYYALLRTDVGTTSRQIIYFPY